MKALRLNLFALVILTVISLSWQKEKLLPSVDICRLFRNGIKLRKPGTCNEGIKCENFVSTPGVQCDQWYSLSTSGCVTRKPSDSYCNAPCAKSSPLWVADTKNCRGWYQCNGVKEISNGICPANQLFDQKQQGCVYNSNCIATYNLCDVVPRNIPFQDENNCRKYYMCKGKDQPESLSCDAGLYFDRATGTCNTKSQVDCYKHPLPYQVCGNNKIAYRNRFVGDDATCRGYFYCKDLGVGIPDTSPGWGQCSVSEFFNPAEQACQDRSHVKCNEDRCDGRIEGEKEISGIKGCQHYLECGNGYTLNEVYCGDGLYFNAELSECTSVKKSYGACA